MLARECFESRDGQILNRGQHQQGLKRARCVSGDIHAAAFKPLPDCHGLFWMLHGCNTAENQGTGTYNSHWESRASPF